MPETTRQREAFDRYWELGAERSVERLHLVMTAAGKAPNLRTLYEWSRRFHWQARLMDLERQARQAASEAKVRAIEEMYERQAMEALLLQQRGTEWLSALKQNVSPEAAIRAIVEGAKLERQARGEPGERIRQEGKRPDEPDFSDFSTEELHLLVEAARRWATGTSEAPS